MSISIFINFLLWFGMTCVLSKTFSRFVSVLNYLILLFYFVYSSSLCFLYEVPFLSLLKYCYFCLLIILFVGLKVDTSVKNAMDCNKISHEH